MNLHEGCGRAKLFWLTAAADAATLKGMIEFKDEGNKKGSSGGFVEAVCRYNAKLFLVSLTEYVLRIICIGNSFKF